MQKDRQIAEKWTNTPMQGAVGERYEICNELNSGAQARAYLAIDKESGREVFVKKTGLGSGGGLEEF